MAEIFWTMLWPGVMVWAALYACDYYLTLACARMYQRGVRHVIAFDGSYEITPYFQKDVDGLTPVSARFVLALVLGCAGIAAVWWLAGQLPWPGAYAFLLGALIGQQVAVHVRHIRNLHLFRAVLTGTDVTGRIQYSRPVMLRLSSNEFLAFAAAFAVLFLMTLSSFLLGAAAGCLSLWANHRRLAATSEASAVHTR